MSKAFTRESDDEPDRPAPLRPAALLPPGLKNLITPGGAQRGRAELQRLLEVARPPLAAASGDDEVRRRLQSLDQRVQQLERTLHTAMVTGPPTVDDGTVRFGATVVVRERSGEETAYRLVGVDETDLDRNWVSWISPVAKALLNARANGPARVEPRPLAHRLHERLGPVRRVQRNERKLSRLDALHDLLRLLAGNFRLPLVPPPHEHVAIRQHFIRHALPGVVDAHGFHVETGHGLEMRGNLVAEEIRVNLLLRGLLLVPDDDADVFGERGQSQASGEKESEQSSHARIVPARGDLATAKMNLQTA